MLSPYRPAELEAVARLLLQDQSIRVSPGAWWSYYPERGEVIYPPNLLAEWPSAWSLGALCHEIAEVLYSGPSAVTTFHDFVERATREGGEARSAGLLLNAINDLRVNRLYLRAFPGSRRYLIALYTASGHGYQALDPKDDLADRRLRRAQLPHHAYLDALTARWAADLTHEARPAPPDDRVRRAVDQTWPALHRAIQSDRLSDLAAIVFDEILPIYWNLLRRGLEELQRQDPDDDPENNLDDGPPPEGSDGAEDRSADEVALIERNHSAEAPVEAWVVLGADAAPTGTEEDGPPRPPPPPSAHPVERSRSASTPSAAWLGGVVQRFQRFGRRGHGGQRYEDFKYAEAVRRLQPQIDAILHGEPGRDGLIAILNRRRFGTLDPWRRPRRRRRGDSGEIDPDHPENLLIAPATAFLKGPRQPREDSQKDFAHVILFDVSGSVVQQGYRSRKFDQLIDTLVVFCELHQRLKLPHELIAFSEQPTVIREFAANSYDNLYIEPASTYTIQDFSYLVREMYRLEHGETHETPALERAIADLSEQRGLKTLFIVTDGISSERPALTALLLEIEQRNQFLPPNERLMIIAFGLGLAQEEFNLSYQPPVEGDPITCSAGHLVPTIEALPAIVCDAVDARIRNA